MKSVLALRATLGSAREKYLRDIPQILENPAEGQALAREVPLEHERLGRLEPDRRRRVAAERLAPLGRHRGALGRVVVARGRDARRAVDERVHVELERADEPADEVVVADLRVERVRAGRGALGERAERRVPRAGGLEPAALLARLAPRGPQQLERRLQVRLLDARLAQAAHDARRLGHLHEDLEPRELARLPRVGGAARALDLRAQRRHRRRLVARARAGAGVVRADDRARPPSRRRREARRGFERRRPARGRHDQHHDHSEPQHEMPA